MRLIEPGSDSESCLARSMNVVLPIAISIIPAMPIALWWARRSNPMSPPISPAASRRTRISGTVACNDSIIVFSVRSALPSYDWLKRMIRCAAKQGALPAPMQRRAPGQTALPPGAQAALPHKPGNPVLATAMTQRWRATWTSSFSADSSAWSWQSLSAVSRSSIQPSVWTRL